MEQAGEEVRTAPIASRDTSVDMTRKKTPAPKKQQPEKGESNCRVHLEYQNTRKSTSRR